MWLRFFGVVSYWFLIFEHRWHWQGWRSLPALAYIGVSQQRIIAFDVLVSSLVQLEWAVCWICEDRVAEGTYVHFRPIFLQTVLLENRVNPEAYVIGSVRGCISSWVLTRQRWVVAAMGDC